MVPSGTFSTYDTYTTSNEYVLWFIWKLSGRLRFPLFKNKKYVLFKIIRKIRLDSGYACMQYAEIRQNFTSKRAHTHSQPVKANQTTYVLELIIVNTSTVLKF